MPGPRSCSSCNSICQSLEFLWCRENAPSVTRLRFLLLPFTVTTLLYLGLAEPFGCISPDSCTKEYCTVLAIRTAPIRRANQVCARATRPPSPPRHRHTPHAHCVRDARVPPAASLCYANRIAPAMSTSAITPPRPPQLQPEAAASACSARRTRARSWRTALLKLSAFHSIAPTLPHSDSDRPRAFLVALL